MPDRAWVLWKEEMPVSLVRSRVCVSFVGFQSYLGVLKERPWVLSLSFSSAHRLWALGIIAHSFRWGVGTCGDAQSSTGCERLQISVFRWAVNVERGRAARHGSSPRWPHSTAAPQARQARGADGFPGSPSCALAHGPGSVGILWVSRTSAVYGVSWMIHVCCAALNSASGKAHHSSYPSGQSVCAIALFLQRLPVFVPAKWGGGFLCASSFLQRCAVLARSGFFFPFCRNLYVIV